MFADVFHREIEKVMKAMVQVCDFNDFMQCMKNTGEAVHMKWKDFGNQKHGFIQSQERKKSCPYLDEVPFVEFQHGSASMFFKEKHLCEEFSKATFLRKVIRTKIETKTYSLGNKYEQPQGIPVQK